MIYLGFEHEIASLEGRLSEQLNGFDQELTSEKPKDAELLERQIAETMTALYSNLSPAQTVQVARHPARPHALSYIHALFDDFAELSGDRTFGEDHAIIAGLGRFRGTPVAILGQEKGSDTNSRLLHNFGMPMPEGYRKAVRLMELADRFGLPVLSFVDSAGAFPGVEAEARGQAQAIATAISTCLSISVPSAAFIIGEGMSGGAMAIAAMSRVYMLKNAVYNVITPEGAASILWRDASKSEEAANTMQVTADALLKFKVIDGIIDELVGGAHRHPEQAISSVGSWIETALSEMASLSPEDIISQKRSRFIEISRNLG
ncbi:Acetyl-coenzyme A carboxylase carboxyl transferase subunit alpha [Pseudovibrio axinellae]|uniref:Acetyl-coenzyme A carboxylase carboxyl transferase subunit alpha n=2 Tax=Pseudovibrio axinellae TaxID=989403 RepID=A0A161VD17_9HYPH|nr:Acetyl-coenzyme A carboxylase carboxyl transferase subunit alpha [Pseudovibrio axinellae]SEQ53926.1 acetyl-CoA carboxylase carboxyl transferase subunit alpha [Pseudovibrio axinellae]